MLSTVLPVHTYCLGGFDSGGRVLDSSGLSVSVTVGDRAGTGGGRALSYLYSSLGISFMSSSTGSRPVCVCVCVCEQRVNCQCYDQCIEGIVNTHLAVPVAVDTC